jgi:phosphate:Na+ symporter
VITAVLGGIGLFLLGMVLLTEGLKAAAGDALRRGLRRSVRGPISAIASGAAVTALAQSSTATTLATIGFVSAGLFTFPQAVGVIFGANLGTTSTGWIVAWLGFKVSVGTLALPLIGVGALLRLLTRDRVAAGGLALAGFGLIFVGIDTLQLGMRDLAARLDPGRLPGDTLTGRLALVAAGAATTVVLQSSSAAVATTLTALESGAISLPQAAALVIGQNVGTTVTAALACIGASTAARRTAVAHILFNAGTGAIAFLILPQFLALSRDVAAELQGNTGTLALAAFHTSFNVLGLLIFAPWMSRFASAVARIVPERGPLLTRRLDTTVTAVAPLAIEAAQLTLREILGVMASHLSRLLRGAAGTAGVSLDAVAHGLDETRHFIGRLRGDPETPAEHQRHLGALHALDHLDRLLEVCRRAPPYRAIELDASNRSAAASFADALGRLAPVTPGQVVDGASLMGETSASLAEQRRSHRAQLLADTASGRVDPATSLERLEAMRWLDRAAYHVWRASHHLGDTAQGDFIAPRETPRSEA